MCKKWGARRLKLFNAIDDPLKSRDQIRAEAINKVPDGISQDQWISYVDYFLKEKTRMTQSGQHRGRGQLYLATHRNEDGSYVNGAAKEICVRFYEKIEQAMTQSTTDESEISPNDAIGKVLGKEHSGRVRCLGLRAIPSRAFKQTRPRYSDLNASSYNNGSCSSQWQEKYNQMFNAHNKSQDNLNFLMNAHTEMMSAFRMYMIRKEGRIPKEFAGLFFSATPPSTASDAASGHVSPTDIRRSCGGSNPNDNQ
ncbi:uncharacterized protein LOC132607988 [Lycium barbarum]|uniref:uncharacterized protein LOC132607988 n=1 Tax=Lycium barbarum TaxID=112863 RepID=UPI00293E1F68|nr:uncharacterized protein LOC132607988 [Lycium barbarum]